MSNEDNQKAATKAPLDPYLQGVMDRTESANSTQPEGSDEDWEDWKPSNPTDKPRRPFHEYTQRRESSFTSVLSDLAIGQTGTRTHSLNESMTLGEFIEEFSEMKAMIANNVRPSVTQAMKRTGYTYRVETSQSITMAGRVLLHVVVTRLT